MLPTFVNKRVTGAERGDFYALDLGGTNFRVLRVEFAGADGEVQMKFRSFALQQSHMTGCGEAVHKPTPPPCTRAHTTASHICS